MDTLTFQKFQKLIYDSSGIVLREGKESLVAARVGRRMRELGFTHEKQYIQHISQDSSGEEMVLLLDAISTNVTEFFREADHFTFLTEFLKSAKTQGQSRFRIWSSACSTGQEPYTIALTSLDALGAGPIDLRILGTDISTRVLGVAKEGRYPVKALETIPEKYRNPDWITKQDSEMLFKQEIKNRITFSRLNLSLGNYPMQGPFDVVFCRNVMIYFDDRVREIILKEICRLLRPGGVLMVGHSETLSGFKLPIKALQPSVYLRVEE